MSLVSSHVQPSYTLKLHAVTPCRVSDLTRYYCRLEILDLFSLTSSARSSAKTLFSLVNSQFCERIEYVSLFAHLIIKTSIFTLQVEESPRSTRNISKIISRDNISQLQLTVTTSSSMFRVQ